MAASAGHTALMLAAKNGNINSVKLLIEYRTNPKRRNSNGKNDLLLARLANKNTVADYLETQQKSGSLFNWD